MITMRWDHESDVVVVGSGAAAHAAAITARYHGSEVVMMEKASIAGGTTLRSGGGFWIPNNRFQRERGIEDPKEDALRYMARLSYPHLYNPDDRQFGVPQHEYGLLSTYYDTASKMVDFFWDIGAVKSIQEINWTGKPQVDYMDHLPENKQIRGRVLYSVSPEGKMSYGGELMRQPRAWADGHGIPLFLNHRVKKYTSIVSER